MLRPQPRSCRQKAARGQSRGRAGGQDECARYLSKKQYFPLRRRETVDEAGMEGKIGNGQGLGRLTSELLFRIALLSSGTKLRLISGEVRAGASAGAEGRTRRWGIWDSLGWMEMDGRNGSLCGSGGRGGGGELRRALCDGGI